MLERSVIISINRNIYFKNKLTDSVGNSLGTWSVIDEILHRSKSRKNATKFNIEGNDVTDVKEIADHFNNHFVSTGEVQTAGVPEVEVAFHYFLNESMTLSP